MTSLYFSFQGWLARLRETGELHPAEYGAGVSPAEYLKVMSELYSATDAWAVDPPNLRTRTSPKPTYFQVFLLKRKLPMKHQHEPKEASTKRRNLAKLDPEEKRLIELLEWSRDWEFTPQEANPALKQARENGDL
jgi:hypothetical protein